MPKLLIGIPMYNCENQIEKVYQKLQEFLKNPSAQLLQIKQIIFLDNHSTDQSLARVQALISTEPLYKAAQNTINIGLGGSHKSLFIYAQVHEISHVAIIHGDNQANAVELEKLIQLSINNDNCTVLGSRFKKLTNLHNYSWIRSAGNRILNSIYSNYFNKKITDLGSGLNLFRVADFDLEIINKFDDQFTFNMDLLIYLLTQKKKFLYTPISWKSEDEVSNARSLQVGWKTLIKLVKWSLFKDKMWKQKERKYILNKL